MNSNIKIILDILVQIFIIVSALYAAFQLFFVFGNDGGSLVLFDAATSISFEKLVARRLYALEFWLIFALYILYLGFRKRIWNYK